MRRTGKIVAAGAVALVVLVAGIGYAASRPARYETRATLVLTPTLSATSDRATLLDSFTAAGTPGTFVELLASGQVARSAGSPPIDLTVRSVPDSRAINLTAQGDRRTLRSNLRAIITAAQVAQRGLGDEWQLRTLSSPSTPVRAGASTPAIVAAAALLALLAGVATLVALGKGGTWNGGRGGQVPVEPLGVMEESEPRTAEGTSSRRRERVAG
jgi:hypothetical protein